MSETRKSPWRFLFLVLAVIGFLLTLLRLLPLLGLTPSPAEVASIAIIGGADGPTAVYMTGFSFVNWLWPILLTLGGLIGFYLLGHIRSK